MCVRKMLVMCVRKMLVVVQKRHKKNNKLLELLILHYLFELFCQIAISNLMFSSKKQASLSNS